ncbi:hypothetical protein ACFSTC_18520 [Nonomuraea ferruginea]
MGEGPQLTALFAVRHREAPERVRGQVFTTGASLKITSFAAGSALAGPLVALSPGAALLAGGGRPASGRGGVRSALAPPVGPGRTYAVRS